MTKTSTLKRLLYSLVIAVIMTILYWIIFTPLIGCFPMTTEEKLIMALFNIGICVLTFIFSLTALSTKITSVSSSPAKIFIAFMGLPLLLFLFSVFVFIFGKTDRENFLDFFEIGMPTTSFFLALLYHYYKFRRGTVVKP